MPVANVPLAVPLADQIVFAAAALLVLFSALMVVLNRHPIYSALFLVLTFIGLSVFFLQLNAPFLAAVQVIVYAGAIMVLFLFVIMLLGEDKPLEGERKLGPQYLLGGLFALGLIGLLSYSIIRPAGTSGSDSPVQPASSVQLIGDIVDRGGPRSAQFGSVQAIGNTLFTDYLFAFEATSIVLLIAMIGVVVLAKRKL